jgi:hypothetical protein
VLHAVEALGIASIEVVGRLPSVALMSAFTAVACSADESALTSSSPEGLFEPLSDHTDV